MSWMNRGYDASPSIRAFLLLPSCKHLPIFGIRQNIVLPNNKLILTHTHTHNRIGADGINGGLDGVTKVSKLHATVTSNPLLLLLVFAPEPLHLGQFTVEFGVENDDVATLLNCLGKNIGLVFKVFAFCENLLQVAFDF